MYLLTLQYYADKFINEPNEENEIAMLNQIATLIIRNKEVFIDGKEVLGGIDPSIIEADTDHRTYYNIYTSKEKFEKCEGKQLYVVSLYELLKPAFEKETFGGITINYKKNEECVLVPKEMILEVLSQLTNNA